jgi:hypothetical protein
MTIFEPEPNWSVLDDFNNKWKQSLIDATFSMEITWFEFINDCFHLLLKSSKTDQLGSGSKIVIGPQHGIEICPVKLLTSYLSVRPKVTGPLFCHYDGKPILIINVGKFFVLF